MPGKSSKTTTHAQLSLEEEEIQALAIELDFRVQYYTKSMQENRLETSKQNKSYVAALKSACLKIHELKRTPQSEKKKEDELL